MGTGRNRMSGSSRIRVLGKCGSLGSGSQSFYLVGALE